MEITIKVVAKKAKVSVATVSRVLRKNPGVRDSTRKKVLKTIDDLNYEVNVVARNLRQKKTNSIGVIVGNILSQFYSTIAKSIEDITTKYGYNIILCNSDFSPEKELLHLKMLNNNRVDGIILTPTGKNANYVNRLLKSDMKLVLLDRLIKGVNCDAVLVDNENGAYQAVKYLIRQGYKDISIISGNIKNINIDNYRLKKLIKALNNEDIYLNTGIKRLKGYLRAINENDININYDFIKFGNFKKESGYKLTLELLKKDIKPQVIFVTNIDMALGSLLAIKESNLKIPKDIGFINFDDSEWSILVDPPVTTIKQPVYRLGFTAAEILLKNIKDRYDNKNIELNNEPMVLTLSTSFVERKSSKIISG